MQSKYNNIDEFIDKNFSSLTKIKRNSIRELILMRLPDDPDIYYRRTTLDLWNRT